MKKLLILLFSIFLLSSSSVFADDISDFEIEGISIGDSLLDYMTEVEILKEIELNIERFPYLNKPYKYVQVNLDTALQTYDLLSFLVKKSDPIIAVVLSIPLPETEGIRICADFSRPFKKGPTK